MSSEPDNVESVQKSEPWKEQKPYIIKGLEDAGKLYGQGAPAYYPGSTYAGLVPSQVNSLNAVIRQSASPSLAQAYTGFDRFARGGNAGSPYLNAAGSGYGAIAGGGGPGSAGLNTALQGYQGAAQNGGIEGAGGLNTLRQAARGDLIGKNPYLDQIYNRGAGDIQSRISGAASAAGRYGSGAMGHQLTQDLGDYNSQLYGGAYAQERANQLGAAQTLQQQGFQGLAGAAGVGGQQQAGALAGLGGQAGVGQQQAANQMAGLQGLSGVDAARIANLQAGLGAGNMIQQNQQNLMNADIQRYNYNANAPMNWLQQYMGTVGAGYGGGTSSTQTPYYQPSPFSQVLGGIAGVAGLGGMFGGGMTNPFSF